MLRVEVITGKSIGKSATFSQRRVRIGTACANDFQIDDEFASDNHGVILTRPGFDSFIYQDQQSMHGSRIHANHSDFLLLDHNWPKRILLHKNVLLYIGKSLIRISCEIDSPIEPVDEIFCIQNVAPFEVTCPTKVEYMQQMLANLRQIAAQNSLNDVLKHSLDDICAHIPQVDRGSMWVCDKEFNAFSCVVERCAPSAMGFNSIGMVQLQNAMKTGCSSLYSVNRINGEQCVKTQVMVIPIVGTDLKESIVAIETTKSFTREEFTWVIEFCKNACVTASRIYKNADLTDVLDGFIRSTISALDTRDPASSGHSSRVATYVMMTAQTISSQQFGWFANTRFSRDELDELRYAALLHDIGKVAIREEIVLKAGRLLVRDYRALVERIELFSVWFATQSSATLGAAWRSPEQFAHYRELVGRLQHPDSTILEDDKRYMLEMANTYIPSLPHMPLLNANEHKNLLIAHGTLNDDERRDIQQHALVSWRYLSKILWPKRWARVPSFVLQHHEKLNGTGYPYGIRGDSIMLQSRILTVCDIFDALTGGDRPYKQRHSFLEAAEILNREVERGTLDKHVVELFIDQVIPQIVESGASSSRLPNIGVSQFA